MTTKKKTKPKAPAKPLAERISVAKSKLLEAEKELAAAMREIRIAPRAEKTSITKPLEDAFHNLRIAKGDLGELEEILSGDD